VQTTFQIAEHDGDRFDPLFVGQIFEAFLLNFFQGNPLCSLLFSFEIEIFQFSVAQAEKMALRARLGLKRQNGLPRRVYNPSAEGRVVR
jgi:hypothetical protein